MGTNFYAHINHCDKCNRKDIQHIGKRSAGWRFVFNPFRGSFAEWKKFLTVFKAKIYDEYDREVSYKEFIQLVKETKDGYYEVDADYETLDPEGYRINKGSEFF